jgi:hypothetical protein
VQYLHGQVEGMRLVCGNCNCVECAVQYLHGQVEDMRLFGGNCVAVLADPAKRSGSDRIPNTAV